MLGGVGKALNSLTGASASASKAHQSSVSLANLSYAQQKQFAQNAHQWEMQDLEKAGLNPALTVTGSSAGSIAGGGSTGGSGAGNVGGLDILSTIGNLYNSSKLTEAQTELMKIQGKADMKNAKANELSAKANMQNAQTNTNKSRGSLSGAIGESMTKGARETAKSIVEWFYK